MIIMKKFIPFSDDIIFFDAEFTDLDVVNGELMSIGMMSLDGKRELYFELEYNNDAVSEWTREFVEPYLTGEKVTQAEAREKIRAFCGKSEPHLVATVNQYDMVMWHKLFDGEDEPINHIPIDFASILFGMGLNPARRLDDDKEKFFAQFGIDITQYKMHNALEDVRLMRDAYIALSEKSIH